MAWIYLAISSSSPLLLTCLVGSILEISTFKHEVLSSGRNYLPPGYSGHLYKVSAWNINVFKGIEVLLKWETTVGTTALSFAVTSLCSDFPWRMVLSAEAEKQPDTLPKKQPGESHLSRIQATQSVGLCNSELPPLRYRKYCCWDKL